MAFRQQLEDLDERDVECSGYRFDSGCEQRGSIGLAQGTPAKVSDGRLLARARLQVTLHPGACDGVR